MLLKVKEKYLIKMEDIMKENLEMDFRMGKVKKYGKMGLNIMEIL